MRPILETLGVFAVFVLLIVGIFVVANGAGSKETTTLDEALERPIKVEKFVTENMECVIVTKHNHTYVQCVRLDKR